MTEQRSDASRRAIAVLCAAGNGNIGTLDGVAFIGER